MDPKLLLVKAITLLYKESCQQDSSVRSGDLAKRIISTIKMPEGMMDYDKTRETLQAVRSTALWMAENPADHTYDRPGLLQRIRINAGDDDALYYAFEQGINASVDEELLKKQCLILRQELRNYLEQVEITALLKSAYHKVAFNPDGVDWTNFVREHHAALEPFTHSRGRDKIEGMVDEVDTSNQEQLGNLLRRSAEEASPQGVIRIGWQGITRMLGEHEGIVRGESVVVGALQHNFKTGFTLNLFKHAALYNKPYMLDEKKKPLLVHISTENSLESNVLWLYANLKENETGLECDLTYFQVEDEELKKERILEATRYVHERLSVNGYNIRMCRMNPSDVSYHTIYDYILQLEAEGYEVHMVVLDYLNMISKKGCTAGPHGFETRDLFRRMRNFMSEHKIAFITPHQLSTEAKQLVRQNVENFVQEIANKGYYDSCRTIDQEVDLELYIHIVKINGESYLTIQRGKHRGLVRMTQEKDKYCVLPFSPIGGIRDDINGPDTTRRHVGGGAVGSGDEAPWWKVAS